MVIRAGEMRHTGALQANTLSGADSYSEVSGLGDVRGRLRRMGGSRSNEGGEIVLNSSWEWIVRFETSIENAITEPSRWVIDNRFFTITGYERTGVNFEWYKFILTDTE